MPPQAHLFFLLNCSKVSSTCLVNGSAASLPSGRIIDPIAPLLRQSSLLLVEAGDLPGVDPDFFSCYHSWKRFGSRSVALHILRNQCIQVSRTPGRFVSYRRESGMFNKLGEKETAMSQPQPGSYPYYPSSPPPHSHDRFVAAIIIGIAVTAVIAGGVGYGLGYRVESLSQSLRTSSQQTRVTFVHGSVAIQTTAYAQLIPPAFDSIRFASDTIGTFSSAALFASSYDLYLPTGTTYIVTIFWINTTTAYPIISCTPTPGVFTPSGLDEPQSFSC
jgi:hypothetical protein